MKLPVKLGMKGRYRFYSLDESGNVERGRGGVPVFRDPSGFLRRAGVWHDNLITDAGLDQLADYMWVASATSGQVAQMRRYLHVGDGSLAPAPADTALANHVGSTGADGGFPSPISRATDATHLIQTGTAVRVYTASGAQNIREFGLSRASQPASADLTVRELVRDENGDPVTLSIADGKKFRLDHEGSLYIPLETTVPSFDVPEYDAGGALVTTRSFVDAKIWPTQGFPTNYYERLEPSGNVGLYASDAVVSSAPSPTAIYGIPGALAAGSKLTDPAYVPGSYTLERGWMLSEAAGNSSPLHTFALAFLVSGSSVYAGYVVALQDGPHPKDSVHQLKVYLSYSWARR